MKIKILAPFLGFAALSATLFFSCSKNNNPTPPIHDTVTVIKKDTLIKNDTLYACNPDSTVNLSKGLLVYLPFSNSIRYSSGHANPTQSTRGTPLATDTKGYSNNAFRGK